MTTPVEKIEGPVFPIVTPFLNDPAMNYPVDESALRRYVDYLIDQGSRVLMVASATSRFSQLTEAEIRRINQIVVQQTGDRATAIASTGILGSTALHVETARHAEANGATVIACEYPWRYQNQAALVDYFRAIVEQTNSIRIMLHVTPGRSELGGQYRYGAEDLAAILDLPRIIGMKEASGDPDVSRAIWQTHAQRTSIIVAGRGMESYLKASEYGVSGFFVGTGNIVPQYSMQFHDEVNSNNRAAAERIAAQHELPFLNKANNRLACRTESRACRNGTNERHRTPANGPPEFTTTERIENFNAGRRLVVE